MRGISPALGRRQLHGKPPIKALPVPGDKFDILFFGGDEFSCQTLRKLEQAKDVWRTLDVVTQSDHQRARHGTKTVESPVKILAQELGLRCHFLPKEKAKMKTQTFPSPFDGGQHGPSQLLIVASLGRFIAWNVLKRFQSSRRLNLHPSMIPQYRGAAPIQWAIADGLATTGVSIIEVERVGMGYDVGDIWAQKPVVIPSGSTYATLMPILAGEGSELLLQVLRRMIEGSQVDSVEQDLKRVTQAPVIDSTVVVADWWRHDAQKIEQIARATIHQKPIFSYVFDGETTLQLHDVSVIPLSAHNGLLKRCGEATLNQVTGNLEVQCASGSQLAVQKVKQSSRKLMASKDWWVGVPMRKRPAGLLQFHMGPYTGPEIHPGFEVQSEPLTLKS
ncbi:hypothetical protein M408DRAFT_62871 [Serendipita vermifera MAFF 305830]|uniref:methionyl-tRNA formyltransferase n=1 Tax=Serendipita vermifera MAFF 305830 TaxID=933852 RepID=A0A0C2XTY2_SERVB|nr:hypothetical protein M408DRAFT_62871 [Serendipita vermifera MAFF 305830]